VSGLVSVAMATYNGAKYLEAQLRSILEQSYGSLEVIISDDASTDETYELVRKMSFSDSRVKAFRQPKNLGLVRNFLDAAGLCKGDFICFSDQDDIWQSQKIETLVNLLKKNPSAMLAYSDLEICDESMKTIQGSFWKASQITPRRGCLHEKALLKNGAPGCSMMFRRRTKELISVLLSDENFLRINQAKILDEIPVMHDHLAWVLSAGLGEVIFTPQSLVKYRQHSQNNIGAFYKTQWEIERFVKCLEARIEALKAVQRELPCVDWAAMRDFLDIYRRPDRPPMPGQMSYFIWMRNNRLRDKFLGILDCLAPSLYRSLKTRIAGTP